MAKFKAAFKIIVSKFYTSRLLFHILASYARLNSNLVIQLKLKTVGREKKGVNRTKQKNKNKKKHL